MLGGTGGCRTTWFGLAAVPVGRTAACPQQSGRGASAVEEKQSAVAAAAAAAGTRGCPGPAAAKEVKNNYYIIIRPELLQVNDFQFNSKIKEKFCVASMD